MAQPFGHRSLPVCLQESTDEGDPGDTRISMPMYSWLRQQFETNEARRRLEKVKQLAGVAGGLGVTLPKLALAWCLKNPNVSTVITGASKPEQVRENMKAGEVVRQLDDGVMKRIEVNFARWVGTLSGMLGRPDISGAAAVSLPSRFTRFVPATAFIAAILISCAVLSFAESRTTRSTRTRLPMPKN